MRPVVALLLAPLALLAACRSLPTDPTPSRGRELVVDVHAHAFNALHLPISGFVAAYSGGDARLGRLVERLALLQSPQGCEAPEADPGDLPDDDTCEAWLELARAVSPRADGGAEQLSDDALDVLEAARADDFDHVWRCRMALARRPPPPPAPGAAAELTDAELDALLDYALGRLAELPASAANLPLEVVSRATTAPTPRELREALERYTLLVWTLTRSSDTVADCLRATYPASDLSIAYMLDMSRWFPEDADVCRPLEQQIEDMAAAMSERDDLGRLHAFLPFDPRREIEQPGRALELVRRNIGRGFVGVKIYPPLGFRASGNAEPYRGEGADPPQPELYDDALERLYAWCEREGVPIAAHAGPGGAESGPDRGLRSHPRYWLPVLTRHPELRLNLGHFGGHDLGVAGGWTETIGELITRFPHVYADFSYTDLPATDAERELWAAFFRRYPKAERRLMFGTDWPMILREPEGHAYLAAARELLDEHFPELREAVLGHNALRYLGLDRPSRNRARVEAFYDGVDEGFRPKRWWRFTEGTADAE